MSSLKPVPFTKNDAFLFKGASQTPANNGLGEPNNTSEYVNINNGVRPGQQQNVVVSNNQAQTPPTGWTPRVVEINNSGNYTFSNAQVINQSAKQGQFRDYVVENSSMENCAFTNYRPRKFADDAGIQRLTVGKVSNSSTNRASMQAAQPTVDHNQMHAQDTAGKYGYNNKVTAVQFSNNGMVANNAPLQSNQSRVNNSNSQPANQGVASQFSYYGQPGVQQSHVMFNNSNNGMVNGMSNTGSGYGDAPISMDQNTNVYRGGNGQPNISLSPDQFGLTVTSNGSRVSQPNTIQSSFNGYAEQQNMGGVNGVQAQQLLHQFARNGSGQQQRVNNTNNSNAQFELGGVGNPYGVPNANKGQFGQRGAASPYSQANMQYFQNGQGSVSQVSLRNNQNQMQQGAQNFVGAIPQNQFNNGMNGVSQQVTPGNSYQHQGVVQNTVGSISQNQLMYGENGSPSNMTLGDFNQQNAQFMTQNGFGNDNDMMGVNGYAQQPMESNGGYGHSAPQAGLVSSNVNSVEYQAIIAQNQFSGNTQNDQHYMGRIANQNANQFLANSQMGASPFQLQGGVEHQRVIGNGAYNAAASMVQQNSVDNSMIARVPQSHNGPPGSFQAQGDNTGQFLSDSPQGQNLMASNGFKREVDNGKITHNGIAESVSGIVNYARYM